MSQPEFRMPDRCFVPTDAASPHEYRALQRAPSRVERRHEVSALGIPQTVVRASHRMRLELREAAPGRTRHNITARAVPRGGLA